MLKKVLIANRGEIACRIVRTCRRLGVRTVAVYSDAEPSAKHVAMADEAVRIGPAPVAQSYLRGDKIIAAALATGADAVHPGYGFLSENPDFSEAVTQAGLRFIGPPPDAIRAMGLKDAAKRIMHDAGVPVVPGYHGDKQNPDALAREAEKIGYPVLIKARAGGGGKGMRRVDDPDNFKAALEGAQREGEASFGDPVCLIEKWIDRPRHIEIQIFGDDHGNVVHLFERDCSLQRRHQKVIEEAPAPGMTPEMRAAMGEAAVRAAKAIGYSGAGTVEFIADVSEGLRPDRFYFMEMNTRLQVEHPVTECITGEDLVAWQLRVAAGETLPKQQDELAVHGWAFEARIYAEDAEKGFLPATGRLDYLFLPSDIARIDSGVRQGDEITPHYDPMIAKVIVHGSTRAAALTRLQAALSESHIAGAVTNVAFLSALCADADFVRGDIDTGLIERNMDNLIEEASLSPEAVALAAITALGFTRMSLDPDPWARLTGWRHWSTDSQFALLQHGAARAELRVTVLAARQFKIEGADMTVTLRLVDIDGEKLRVEIAGRVMNAKAVEHGANVTVFLEDRAYEFAMPDRLSEDEEGDAGGDTVTAPMPGLIKLLAAKPRKPVSKGEVVIVMEAMKMEHTLTAPRDGKLDRVLVKEGDQVEAGMVLLTFAEEVTDAS